MIGARLYHVLTDWERFEGNWLDVFKVWEGGLGIPGGMLAGVLVGVYVGHRRGIPIGPGLNAVAPALPLAQAIGRWGNYFNQELYGKPDRPAVGAGDRRRPPAGDGQYPSGTTFHPTFLYESLWNLGLVGLILWLDKRFRGPAASCSRSTCSATASGASGSRACASTRPTSSAACAGTSGWRSR